MSSCDKDSSGSIPDDRSQQPEAPSIPSTMNKSASSRGKARTRSNGGSRGPIATACEACRRRKSKCVRRSRAGNSEEPCFACDFEASIVPLVFQDLSALQARFDFVGQRLDKLSPEDQLRCRLIWSAAAQQVASENSPDETVAKQTLVQAQTAADSLAIWSKPSFDNCLNLLLLFFVTSGGELTSREANYYLAFSCQHFEHVYHKPADLYDSMGRPQWTAATLALSDLASALELKSFPHIPKKHYAVFGPEGDSLPRTETLRDLLRESPTLFVDSVYSLIPHYLYTGRTVADHFARSVSTVTVEEDIEVVQQAWNSVDEWQRWVLTCNRIILSDNELTMEAKKMSKASLTFYWLPYVWLEHSILEVLCPRLELLSTAANDADLDDVDLLAKLKSLTSLCSMAQTRCQQTLCFYLGFSRNRDGVQPFSSSAGFQFSASRLKLVAHTLLVSPLDQVELFSLGALDKLASVT
ncbi:hypothetical protein JCM3765_006013 [Sporobolomyces pararoseus]